MSGSAVPGRFAQATVSSGLSCEKAVAGERPSRYRAVRFYELLRKEEKRWVAF